MSDEVDLELKIPLNALVDEVTCPICFSWCKKARMTPCGHNFCASCLDECLNRAKKCPVCSQDVTDGDCVDNKHHDRLVDILRQERERASKAYFEDLVANAGGGGGAAGGGGNGGGGDGDADMGGTDDQGANGAAGGGKKLTPIEQVFHQHLQKGLLAYEAYFESVNAKFKRAMDDAQKASELRCQQMREKHGGDEAKAEAEVAAEMAKAEAVVAELKESLEASTALMVESYAGFLEEAIPSTPQFLPVAVVVEVPSQNLKLPRLVVKPTDSAKDVEAAIAAKLEANGNPMVALGDDCRWVVRAPFAAPGGGGASHGADGGKEEPGKDDRMVVVKDLHAPLIQHGLVPGATVILEGAVQCKADMPKSCFRQTFREGEKHVVDYFSCRDCKTNWLCKGCAESCHDGHRIVEYIPQHEPSWACCYCFKTKQCKLQPKRAASKRSSSKS